jgi:hypothetical protein
VPGTSYRSPNTATGIRPTSISHAQSEMGAKEPSTTQSLRTGSATGSTIRSWLDGHTREISRESEKLARRPPRANASRTPSQRHWPGYHPGLELNEEARNPRPSGKGTNIWEPWHPSRTPSLGAGSSRLHRGWRGDRSGRPAVVRAGADLAPALGKSASVRPTAANFRARPLSHGRTADSAMSRSAGAEGAVRRS